MKDQWTDRLSDYLDGELAAGEREALEAHLASCTDCAATLDELRHVVARAHALDDRQPRTDLWPQVAQRIGAGKVVPLVARRRISFSVPQLAAASIALMLLGGGAVRLALHRGGETRLARTAAPTSPPPVQQARWTMTADAAVAQLQDALTRNESRLDTATVRVVREKLAVIDRAIGEAQRALAADPGNAYLNQHLADTMRRKIELLRRANALAVQS